MRIKSKEEVLKEYKNKYKELDNYFISHLSEEYDKYYKIVKDLQTKDEILAVFEKEIEKKKGERRYPYKNAQIICILTVLG